jgi:hypothetical protein
MVTLAVLKLGEGVTWQIDEDHAELLIDDKSPKAARDLCARMYVQRTNRRYRDGRAWSLQDMVGAEV